MEINKSVLGSKNLGELIRLLQRLDLELYLIADKELLDNFDSIDIRKVNSLSENNVQLTMKVQKLDKELYGNIEAEHWVIYTFGAKAGFILVIMKNNDEIISYSQVVGCIEDKKVQLWGLGTRKEYQNRGFGTLMYRLTKEICKKLGKTKMDINVEPENVSNKIYCKDEPQILAFGNFYPDEPARHILSVSLNPEKKVIDSTRTMSLQKYCIEMRNLIATPDKKFLLDWFVKDDVPYLTIGFGRYV